MIKEVKVIVKILDKIQNLLLKANEIEWEKNIRKIKEMFESTPPEEVKILARKTLSLFAGMGSFNDIVLYVNNKVDSKINQSFNELRRKLYNRLKELL
ncbi:MAG TPA: hypothetical protein PLE45_12220 [Spirochaetota bacterium]|nr:hypothetical protein [Spirochaetota bacterium]HPP05484.1 hypothetical protein [Spirochaetota bacterium]